MVVDKVMRREGGEGGGERVVEREGGGERGWWRERVVEREGGGKRGWWKERVVEREGGGESKSSYRGGLLMKVLTHWKTIQMGDW